MSLAEKAGARWPCAAVERLKRTLAMFAEHLAECRVLAEQASGELERLKEAPEQDRPGLSAAAFSLLKQARRAGNGSEMV